MVRIEEQGRYAAASALRNTVEGCAASVRAPTPAQALRDLLNRHGIGAGSADVTALVATEYPALTRLLEALRAQIAASVTADA